MNLSRRNFLKLGASSLLACGSGVPLFLARTARVIAGEQGTKAKGRVLVVIELSGGNALDATSCLFSHCVRCACDVALIRRQPARITSFRIEIT